jgi:hypothetical protein
MADNVPPLPNADIATEYSLNRESQMTPEAEAQRRLAEYEAQSGAVAPEPGQDPKLRQAYENSALSTSADAATPENPQRGFMADMGMSAVGGVRDAFTETSKAIDSLGGWMNENVLNLGYINYDESGLSYSLDRKHETGTLPEVDASDRVLPSLTRGVTQFVTDFIPFNRFAKFLRMGKVVGPAVAGGATLATAFDPFEKRLSNLVNDYAQEHPAFANSVTEYLAADPKDSEGEARFKNALEGMGLGLAAEGLVRSLKVFKFAKAKVAEEATAAPAADATASAAQVEVKAADAAGAPKATTAPVVRAKPYVQVPKEQMDTFVSELTGTAEKPVSAQHALSSLARAGEGIDFNFERVAAEGNVKALLNDASSTFQSLMNKVKGGVDGVRTHDTVEEIAKLTGTDAAHINNLYANTKNLDSKFFAARQVLVSSAKRLSQLAEKAAGAEGTDLDLIALRSHANLHVAIQAEVKGVQTEIARAVSAMRITAKGTIDADALDTLLRTTGGRGVNKAFAKAITKMTDPVQISNFVRQGAYGKTRDAVIEYYINSILSGAPTQVVNILSNTVMIPMAVSDRLLTAGIGAARQAVGLGSKDRAAFIEANGQVFGIVQGLKDALGVSTRGMESFKKAVSLSGKGKFKEAAEVLRQDADEFGSVYRTAVTEEPVLDPMTKLEHRHKAISAQAFEATGITGKMIDYLGFVTGLPSRALVTADELFKTVHHRMELYSQAYRTAADKGLTGEAFKTEVANIVKAPSRDMNASAIRAAREGTFTQELGQFGGTVQKAAAIAPTMRLVVPFIRTPANILKYVGVRTPLLNLAAESQRAALKAGGRQADLVMAKMSTGLGLYALAFSLAERGVITGGPPSDPDVARFQHRDGKVKDYAFHIGDEYIGFDRSDPLGMFFGLAADIHTIANTYYGEDGVDMSELPSVAMMAISNNLTNRTWLSGVSSLIQALDTRQGETDPKALRYVRDMSAAFVPNFLKGVRTSGEDAEVKEVWGFVDAWKNKLPGYSKDVPAQRSLFGEKVLVPNRLGPDFLSPIANPTGSDDPVVKEIMRLGIGFKKPDKKIGNVMLTPQLYTRRDELAGKEVKDGAGRNLHDRLAYEMSTERYKNATDGDSEYEGSRGYITKRVVAAYRQMAEQQLMKEHPELQKAVRDDKVKAASVLSGKLLLQP